MSRHTLLPLIAGVLLGIPVMAAGQPTSAATDIVVDGSCTLVDAINAANTDTAVGSCPAGSGDDTITLAQDVTLSTVDHDDNGLPDITSDITIDGAGHVISRDPAAPDFRIFNVESSYTLGDGVLRLDNTTISNGRAAYGAAIRSIGSLFVTNSTIRDSVASIEGGGIDATYGRTHIVSSTITGNVARDGAGVSADGGELHVLNSTISGNRSPLVDGEASGRGAGVMLWSDVVGSIRNTTIADNVTNGGALFAHLYNPFPLSGVLLSNPAQGCVDLFDQLVSEGYNMDSSEADACNFDQPTDAIDVGRSGLGPLEDNGGPTQTHGLLSTSPALDAIPPDACDVSVDQRGVARPVGAGCDIGAFEGVLDTTVLSCAGITGTEFELAALGYHVITGVEPSDVLNGTDGDDFIVGTTGRDVIDGRGGDDVICGLDGPDNISGGPGDDTIDGGHGNDRIGGGGGDDVIVDPSGSNRLDGQGGADTITGGGADDTIIGGGGADDLKGLAGNDIILGGDGADRLEGGGGNDDLQGEGGNDIIWGHAGNDRLDGGGGNDRLFDRNGTNQLDGGPGNRDRCVFNGKSVVANCER